MANPTTVEIGAARAVASGAISWAPFATAPPTTAVATLPGTYKGLGYVGSDGIQPTREVSITEVPDMNGDIVATLQESFGRTYQAQLLQADNVDIKKMIFGDANVTVTPAAGGLATRITVVDKGLPAAHGVLVCDTFKVGNTGAIARHREVAVDAQPVEVEYGPYVATAVRSYTVTWRVFKDSSGNYVTEYDDDGIPVA